MENGYHHPGGGGSYHARLRAFRESDNERDAMVKELIDELELLKIRHEKLSDDYANEAESRLRFQRMVKSKDQELNEHKRAAVSGPSSLLKYPDIENQR